MIAIIDYGMGNLRSVYNAFQAIGGPASIATGPASIKGADKIVLPGVGAFGDGMDNLRAGGWVAALEDEVRGRGKPFLGLCLGMQLMAATGSEHGDHQGLGWIAGSVDRLQPSDRALRVPHIGWNDVAHVKVGGLYRKGGDKGVYYFVHSYAMRAADESVVSGWCDYGGRFAASIERDNLFGVQYHPEKSQKCGLAAIRNFATL